MQEPGKEQPAFPPEIRNPQSAIYNLLQPPGLFRILNVWARVRAPDLVRGETRECFEIEPS
jgi:hypothetical protein